MKKFVSVIFSVFFALSIFSCADILNKASNIKIVLPPPLADANTHFSSAFRAPGGHTEYAPDSEYYVFGFLCRPLPLDVTGRQQGEVYKEIYTSSSMFKAEFNEENSFSEILARVRNPKADPDGEIIELAATTVASFENEITLRFSSVNVGTELYVLVYVFEKGMNYDIASAQLKPYLNIKKCYITGEKDSKNELVPKPVIATGGFMYIPLQEKTIFS